MQRRTGEVGRNEIARIERGASERSTESVLRAVCLRLGCTAATAIFPREDSRAVWSRSEEDAAFARQQLSIVGDELARRAIETRKPVATNKLKHVSGGQIACKLVAVPLIARGGPAGALIIFNRPDEPSFDEFTVRRLGRFARLLARNATQDLDSLTGLLSWDGFKTRVDTWQRNAPPGAMVSMLYGDIDCLHLINDLAGFSDGDRVIARCGVRDPPRAGGRRQFRLPPVRRSFHRVPAAHESGAGAPARRQHLQAKSARGPPPKQEPNHPVSMSWGAVSTSAADLHLDHRIAEAEIACKTAKDRGRGRVEVYQDTDQSMIRRHDEIGLIGSVREALRLERIVVYAQPITPLINHSLPTTYELLRAHRRCEGQHRRGGRLHVGGDALPDPAGDRPRRVRARLRAAQQEHFARRGPLRVSINLSGPTLSDPDFLEWLLASMAKYGIDGTCLVFEITEAAAAANLQQVQQFIRRLTQPRRALRARRFRHGRELAGLSQESRDQHHQARRLVRASTC